MFLLNEQTASFFNLEKKQKTVKGFFLRTKVVKCVMTTLTTDIRQHNNTLQRVCIVARIQDCYTDNCAARFTQTACFKTDLHLKERTVSFKTKTG